MADFDNAEAATNFLRKPIEVRGPLVFAAVVAHAHRSIQTGSEVTGSRGQPVGQYGPGYHPGKVGGELRASYVVSFGSATDATISTNAPYAQSNEDGIARPGGGPYRQRSTVGGRHSIALTIDATQRIIDYEERRLGASS